MYVVLFIILLVAEVSDNGLFLTGLLLELLIINVHCVLFPISYLLVQFDVCLLLVFA